MFRYALLVFCALAAACSPAPDTVRPRPPALPAAERTAAGAEISVERILRDLIGRVVVVNDASGEHTPTEWTFEKDEFKQVEILERSDTPDGIVLTIAMTTRNNPRPNEDAVQVNGRLRLHYQRKGGGWALGAIDNLSFKYTVGIAT